MLPTKVHKYLLTRTTDAQRGNDLHCTAENSIPIPNFLTWLGPISSKECRIRGNRNFAWSREICCCGRAQKRKNFVRTNLSRMASKINFSQGKRGCGLKKKLFSRIWIIFGQLVQLWREFCQRQDVDKVL